MTTVIISLLAVGFIYLVFFHKPVNPTEDELKSWFSLKLSDIANILEKDIEEDNKGLYAHADQHSFKKHGEIIYTLLNKNGARFDISDKNPINIKSIMTTDGYKQLDQKVKSLNLTITLEENEINTYDDDEYIVDHLRYFTVTISGW